MEILLLFNTSHLINIAEIYFIVIIMPYWRLQWIIQLNSLHIIYGMNLSNGHFMVTFYLIQRLLSSEPSIDTRS